MLLYPRNCVLPQLGKDDGQGRHVRGDKLAKC